MSFPETLDNARVLYYTAESCYGDVCYTTGELADRIRYLAICKYEDDDSFYLFGCNTDYEVVSDSPWGSAEECMRVSESTYNCVISWIAMA